VILAFELASELGVSVEDVLVLARSAVRSGTLSPATPPYWQGNHFDLPDVLEDEVRSVLSPNGERSGESPTRIAEDYRKDGTA